MTKNPQTKSGPALRLLALMAVPIAFYAVPASARVDVGINFGFPAIIAPPVYVAPPPVVYAAPPVYAVQPQVVYPSGPYVAGGYWWHDRWGHRHWHRR
jgi:hypothetical protein